MSADAPHGEYVDSLADESRASEPRRKPVDVPDTNWMQSSIDLAEGLEVIDRTDMPEEWFGRWFGK
ncbi:MAG TPA: hypothetical protein VFZ93_00805 [Albitalea sp.]